ncbi:HAMP domain-containing methyl-accepting chemotaxis protein [Denitromonas iodatirespirans]|uniref:HAMP domain-containing methyl-accepting chemotaxis protein n=1 Tax=Denitromonas iodatirespirans TaxID=2795389 RepID=UPI001E4F2FF5|nr:methyl-accepting chemotaxis protein [Denitromonas iodatirespirans]
MQFFTNLRSRFGRSTMARKLGFGFGLVLLLTGVVAAIGVTALQTIELRFDQLKLMAQINRNVLLIRQHEQAFSLSEDPAEVDALRSGIDAILGLTTALKTQSAAMAATMDEVELEVTAYRTSFDEFVNLAQRKQRALDTAAWSVQNVTNNLDLVHGIFVEDAVAALTTGENDRGEALIEQAGQLGETGRLVLQALNEAHVRLEQSRRAAVGTEVDAGARIPQTEEAAQLIKQLIDVAGNDPAYRGVLKEAASLITTFNERLDEYTELLTQERKVHAQMIARAEQVMRRVDNAYTEQDEAMRNELGASAGFIFASSLVALLAGLAAAMLITRAVVKPLRSVIRVADRIADGDLTAKIESHGTDEVGQLMRAMSRMSLALRDIVGGLKNGIGSIATSAQTLSSAAERANAEVGSQKQETAQVATAMSEIVQSLDEVARSAADAASAADSADSKVQYGRKVVQGTMSRIEQLAAAAGAAHESMLSLDGEVQNIGAVLDVIKSLAEQTNLLALNAAIEAARAGEQGRGFAVVADEVRLLAQRTHESTAKIEGLILAVVRSTQDSMQQIGASSELVETTVADAHQTESALHSIADAVSVIHRMNQQIAAAAEQQSAVVAEVNRSVDSIRDSADQSAAAMQGTAVSSTELAQLSTTLHGMVGRFQL